MPERSGFGDTNRHSQQWTDAQTAEAVRARHPDTARRLCVRRSGLTSLSRAVRDAHTELGSRGGNSILATAHWRQRVGDSELARAHRQQRIGDSVTAIVGLPRGDSWSFRPELNDAVIELGAKHG